MSAWDGAGAVLWSLVAILTGLAIVGTIAKPGPATDEDAKQMMWCIPTFLLSAAASGFCIARLFGAHL